MAISVGYFVIGVQFKMLVMYPIISEIFPHSGRYYICGDDLKQVISSDNIEPLPLTILQVMLFIKKYCTFNLLVITSHLIHSIYKLDSIECCKEGTEIMFVQAFYCMFCTLLQQ